MTECNYCDKNVAMPYTCSLCKNKHCGKHRLAESHDCQNVDAYRTPQYTKMKLDKTREMRAIKAGNDPETQQSMVSRTSQTSLPGNLWSAESKSLTIFIGGVLLGLVSNIAAMVGYIRTSSLTYSLQFLGAMLVLGGIGMYLVYQVRKVKAEEVNVITGFMLWPIGIVISLITGLLGIPFLTFGYFTNSGSDLKSEADVAKNSVYLFAGLFICLRIIVFIFNALISGIVPDFVLLVLFRSADMFLWFGLIMMLPFRLLDGYKMYQYNTREYWYHLGGMIVLIIFSIISGSSL